MWLARFARVRLLRTVHLTDFEKKKTILQSSWNETEKLIKPIGFFCLSFFFNALVPVASWDLEVPIDVVDVNCQNFPVIRYTRSRLDRNEILKSMLTCSTYLSLLSSPVVFAQIFSLRFLYYLKAWIHGTDYFMWSVGWHADVDGS